LGNLGLGSVQAAEIVCETSPTDSTISTRLASVSGVDSWCTVAFTLSNVVPENPMKLSSAGASNGAQHDMLSTPKIGPSAPPAPAALAAERALLSAAISSGTSRPNRAETDSTVRRSATLASSSQPVRG